MSILGYVSALLHLMLSGYLFGHAQSGQTGSPATSPASSAKPATDSPAATALPSPQTEGLGQVGLVLESALGGGASQPGTQGNTAATPPEAAQKGLGTALDHVGNTHAKSVLEALLARVAAETPSHAMNLTDLPDWNISESEARRLAELRVEAHRREDILRRISTAATPPGQADTAGQNSDPTQALLAQMTAFSTPQGAYSIFSLAAISPEAMRGQGIRLTL